MIIRKKRKSIAANELQRKKIMIRLGYVGINTELPTAGKTFRLANYSKERMLQVARSNIQALNQILLWNKAHNIKLFRITSALIPFGSHLINKGEWKNELKAQLFKTGEFIINEKMRVSMHPGQYTVINSPHEQYYLNSMHDIEYHNNVLNLMGLDNTHKIIIHGGGLYNDKKKSMKLLTKRLKSLPQILRERVVLENDERCFSADEIYNVCMDTALPGIFDVLHHEVNPSFESLSEREIILKFKELWGNIRQKIHYSNQASGKHKGAHSQHVCIAKFLKFYRSIEDLELDIMLEVKDKQESVLEIKKNISSL